MQIKSAVELVKTAGLAFDSFKDRNALRGADEAEALLIAAQPDDQVTRLLAQINFLRGLVHLRQQNRGLAVQAFGLAHTLDPEREKLDPARYKPAIVAAFEAGVGLTGRKATATLNISATFDVPIFLDGKMVANAPVNIPVSAGQHYVVASSPNYTTQGLRVDIAEGETLSKQLELRPVPAERRAQNIRRTLLRDQSDKEQAYAAAGRESAGLAGAVACIVLRTGSASTVVASIFDTATGKLSYWRPADADIDRMFGILVPVREPFFDDRDLFPPSGRDSKWYQRPVVIGVISTSVLAAVALGILSLTAEDATQRPRPGRLGGPGALPGGE